MWQIGSSLYMSPLCVSDNRILRIADGMANLSHKIPDAVALYHEIIKNLAAKREQAIKHVLYVLDQHRDTSLISPELCLEVALSVMSYTGSGSTHYEAAKNLADHNAEIIYKKIVERLESIKKGSPAEIARDISWGVIATENLSHHPKFAERALVAFNIFAKTMAHDHPDYAPTLARIAQLSIPVNPTRLAAHQSARPVLVL